MKIFYIVAGVILTISVLFFLLCYVCYRITFYSNRKKPIDTDALPLPHGEIYQPFYGVMTEWMLKTRSLSHELISTKSFDGLTLYGKYYECKKGAPIEIMFHGYRGGSERDLCGGVLRAFKLQRNVLVIDQRASGLSQGKVITFGINESKDCISWVNYAVERFGKDVKLLLTGISMGASTVLIASAKELPENVVSVVADCGFTSAKAIIKKCIKDMHLPPTLLYPFIKLGGKIFGKFDLEETSPIEAMKNCKVPVIFIHGDDDAFVPYCMSKENYHACVSKKELLIVKGAGHGLSYPVAPDEYVACLNDFYPTV